MGSCLTHAAGFWLCFVKPGRDARVTLRLWSAPVSSSRNQEGIDRLQESLPVIIESDFCFTSLVHYSTCTAGRRERNTRTKPPMLPEDPTTFLQSRAVKFRALDKFQSIHNVLICTALTVPVEHVPITLTLSAGTGAWSSAFLWLGARMEFPSTWIPAETQQERAEAVRSGGTVTCVSKSRGQPGSAIAPYS